MVVKTLRAFIAEVLDDMGSLSWGEMLNEERAEVVEAGVRATRDWLAQPGVLALIASDVIRLRDAQYAAAALRREAVK